MSNQQSSPAWASRLLTTEKGVLRVTLANLSLIFEHDINWRGVLALNERTQQVEFRRAPPPDVRARVGDRLLDEHETQTALWVQSTYGMPLTSSSIIHSAMLAAATAARFDPVREWLESLPAWDVVDRLDSWLADVTGCPQDVYHAAVGRVTLIGAVARVFAPGCKFDTTMILQGPQGALKSTLLAELVGREEWFCDHISDIGGKDAALQLCGPWLLEFAELDAITAKRENERVKAWITQRVDRYRPPYGRQTVDVPRRVFFAGSTNADQFLRDETGGRRFLPVRIRGIDLTPLREMREALWSEAVARYRNGEKWWMTGEALTYAVQQQEDRRIPDPWEEIFAAYLANSEPKFDAAFGPTGKRIYTTSGEMLAEALKIEFGRQSQADMTRAGRCLGLMGWRRETKWIEGKAKKVWFPPLDADGELVTMTRPAVAPEQQKMEWK